MENQLESSIFSMSDSDFDSILSGGAQPQTETPVQEQVTGEAAPVEVLDNPFDSQSIAPLDDDFFKEIEAGEGEDAPETPTGEGDEEVDGSLDPQVAALRNTVEFYIQEGIWDDFEGREEFDFSDNKKVADLMVKQTQQKAFEIVDSEIESTGPYGKAIINYIRNGGDPDELIDLFKEERQVTAAADVDTDEGKKAFIADYYTRVAHMKPERAKKVVEALEMEGELDSELNEVKGQYKEYYKQQEQAKQAQAAAEAQAAIEREEQFRNTILSEVTKRNDLTDKQRRELAQAVLVEDYQLQDGTQTSKFYASLAAAQNNINDYLELVEFVTDKENYKKRLKTEVKNETKKEDFNFIKKGASLSRKTGSTQTQPTQKPTTFKFI